MTILNSSIFSEYNGCCSSHNFQRSIGTPVLQYMNPNHKKYVVSNLKLIEYKGT